MYFSLAIKAGQAVINLEKAQEKLVKEGVSMLAILELSRRVFYADTPQEIPYSAYK